MKSLATLKSSAVVQALPQKTFQQQFNGKVSHRQFSERNPNQQQQHDDDDSQQDLTLMEQFKQQMLKAWQPVPTLTKTILLFFIMSLIFLGIYLSIHRYQSPQTQALAFP